MELLAIETTGAAASAALIDENGRLREVRSDQTMNHLHNLLPMVKKLLDESSLKIGGVSGIAVSEGPGSFTGIRIGMATAKALAQVIGVPVVSVPTLRSFVYHIPDFPGVVCPIFDARRSQVYGGAYQRTEDGSLKQWIPDGAYDIVEYLDLVADALSETAELLFFGDGIAPYQKQIEEWNESTYRVTLKGEEIIFATQFVPEELRYQKASSVARLGLEMWKKGETKNYFELSPVYLRKAEAERKLLERQEAQRAVKRPGEASAREEAQRAVKE